VKRVDLIRHLERHGCVLFREGGSHSVYINPRTRKSSRVPRHRESNEFLAHHSAGPTPVKRERA
jgi:mRNA interferase HicA